MVELEELERFQLAKSLIQSGMRLSIVRVLTNISTRTLRKWWHDIHGVKPPNGKLPESVLSFIRDRDMAAKLSAFVCLYKKLYKNNFSLKNFFATWRGFQDICGQLDINAAYYAIRDVNEWAVVLSKCRICGASFLYDAGSKNTNRCPFCNTKVL